MKQAKRMLSVLLALIIMCSMTTIGANALKTSYVEADHYNDTLDPVMSTEQVATMLLDMIDTDVLPGLDVNVEITSNLFINLGSVDKTLDSLRSVDTAVLAAIAMPLLGDIGDLDLSMMDDDTRRRSSHVRDMAVLIHVLGLVEADGNPEVISNILDNSFDFGALETFGVLDKDTDLAMFNDLHGFVTDMLYNLLYGEGASTAEGTTYTTDMKLEEMLQQFIDYDLVKMIVDMGADSETGSNSIGEFLGFTTVQQEGPNSDLDDTGCLRNRVHISELLPTLSPSTEEGDGKLGYLSLTGDSTLDFIWKILMAAIQDLVVPYAGTLLADMLGSDGEMIFDLVMNLIIEVFELDASELNIPEDANLQVKLDCFLKWFLVGGGISQFVHFEKTFDADGNLETAYLTFAEGLDDKMCNLIVVVLPMLPGFWEDAPAIDKTDEELSAMSNVELVTYVLQVFLESLVDGLDFPDETCASVKELASRTLVEVAAELTPTVDFEQMFEENQLIYDSEDCLTVGAKIAQYYLNGHTTMQNATEIPSIHEILEVAVDWALGEYGGLFGYEPSKYAGSHVTVWDKLYDTVFQVIPIDSFYGVEDSAAGVEDFIMNKLIGSILDLKFNQLVSIVGVHPGSGLNKSLPDLLIDLVGRVLNPLLGLPFERDYATSGYAPTQMAVPYEFSTLDELITVEISSGVCKGCGLKNLVVVLLSNLKQFHETTESTLYSIMPMLGSLIGLWNPADYPFAENTAPADYPILNIDEFKALYNQYSEEANDGKSYDDDSYSYFHMVDFKGFLYKDFKDARDACGALVAQYEQSLTDPEVTAPTRTEMTNAAYYMEAIHEMLTTGYNMDGSKETYENDYEHYGETTASNYQLNKVINRVEAANYTQVDNGDGTFTYSERTWKAYEKAYNFALKVNAEYVAAAGADDPGKALRDMRQSRINEARKQLIKAAKELKEWTPLADYSMLDGSIDVVSYITTLRKYDPAAVQQVIDAYLEAINLDRDYDVDDQLIVDNRQTALDEAVANLDVCLTDYIDLYNDGALQMVDENTGYLYGLDEGFANPTAIEEMGTFNDYFMGYYGYGVSAEYEYYNLVIHGTATGNGTGSVIRMYSMDDEALESPKAVEYPVVILGDVDGDAYIDGQDAVLLRAYNAMMFADVEIGGAVLSAADPNMSGTIDSADYKLCEQAGLKKEVVNQQPDEIFTQTYGVLDVLGLR
ncbi:MAG: hypothetical protein IJZ57_06275 [Clostridia bacterium]|nr:hypothetical protein [Clostridia bacterium]